MNTEEYRQLLAQLRTSLLKLRETGLLRRTHPDGSFFWEDCEPLAEDFQSAGKPAVTKEAVLEPAC